MATPLFQDMKRSIGRANIGLDNEGIILTDKVRMRCAEILGEMHFGRRFQGCCKQFRLGLRTHRAQHHRHPFFENAPFSLAMERMSGPKNAWWSRPMFVMTATSFVGMTFVESNLPPMPVSSTTRSHP